MQFPTSKSSLTEWLAWLENTRPEQDIDLGLDRIRLIGDKIDLLSPAPFVITVAGTNGKGSTIAILESILRQAGCSVGVFTSPHFLKFNERIRVNGEMVSDGSLCEAFATINEGREQIWLTYFEFATLAAVHCFKKATVDIALMEVGLGGRLDATNAIDPDLSIITTVDFDHQDWLGYSIEAIAREKAGIMRGGKPAVFGDCPVPQSVLEQTARLDVPLYRRDNEFSLTQGADFWSWSGIDKFGNTKDYSALPFPDLMVDNAATALQALQFLPESVSEEAIHKGLTQCGLTGRYQKIEKKNKKGASVSVIVDVAHNPQAAMQLCKRLQAESCSGETHMVIAMYRDKEYQAVVDVLSEEVSRWYATEFESPRALAAEALNKIIVEKNSCSATYPSVNEALKAAIDSSSPKDRVIVAGSFITVAEVLTDNG